MQNGKSSSRERGCNTALTRPKVEQYRAHQSSRVLRFRALMRSLHRRIKPYDASQASSELGCVGQRGPKSRDGDVARGRGAVVCMRGELRRALRPTR